MTGRSSALIAASILVAVVFSAFAIREHFVRKNTVYVSLYSGNSWGVPQNFAYAVYDKAVEMFEARPENHDIRIVLKTGTMQKDYSEWFAQLVLKGQEPDVFLIVEEDFSTYASIGLLEDLDPYLDDRSGFDEEDFYAQALEAGRYKGSQYSLPISMVPSFLIVNRSLLAEKGLSVDMESWTWEQFRDICTRLTEDTDRDGAIDRYGVVGYDWHHAFYTNDEALFDSDSPTIRFDNRRMEETVDHLKELHHLNQGKIVTERDFAQGHVGFKIFNLSEFRAYGTYPYRILKYENFTWDVIPFPAGSNGRSASKLYTVQVGMSSRSRHKAAASAFIKFMSGDEDYQLEVWNGTNTMPVLKSVIDTVYGDQAHSNEETKTLDRETLENVISNSYIAPNFKSYSSYDSMISQKIFQIVAQDLDTKRSVAALRRDIEDWEPQE